MLAQSANEVIVVDFCCPDKTGDHVEANFPGAQVVRAEGEEHFSNWKARNLGATAATSDLLVFCDADTILADGAIAWIAEHLPERTFGFFRGVDTAHLNTTDLRLAQNQLRGFLVVPSRPFRRLGGYDEVLIGWGAGGDTDLVDRLGLLGFTPFAMDAKIVESVVPHDNRDRLKHHVDPIPVSYGAGLLYRSAKLALLRIRNRINLPLTARQNLYATAKTAAQRLGAHDKVALTVNVQVERIGMPRQLGYEKGRQTLSLKVEVDMQDKIAAIPG